jgi:hypothetical protein
MLTVCLFKECAMSENHKKGFRLVSESTHNFFRKGRALKDYSFWDKVHGYVYARWPYLYIGIGKGEHPIARKLAPFIKFFGGFEARAEPEKVLKKHSMTISSGTFADGYHGKAYPARR